jgi:subtilase family protein/type IX secretion system substrate protein/MBG domain-containing protein
MRRFTLAWQRAFCLFLIICLAKIGKSQTTAQTLRLQDFTIWGGSAPANSYISSQGVVFNNTAVVQGNVGSNHLINVKNNLTITGSLYSGNLISFSNNAKITGNVFANRSGTTTNPAIAWGSRDTITGNLTANGKIAFGTYGKITGQVAVPAPTTSNYSGPTPSNGFTNTLALPTMPSMPGNSAFDNKIGTTTISNTQTVSPGIYKKLGLTGGGKTITFDGPGNYIFFQVDNGTTSNKFIFDFKGTTAGTFNIFVIKDARWGLLSVSTKNGNDASRIFTEVHGDGSTNGGNAFDLQGPTSIPAGSNLWLGNVWAPNGAISITSCPILPTGASHIIGALWSGKQVSIKNDFKITYQAPAAGPDFKSISPYFPPPPTGKVDAANNVIGPELLALSQNSSVITSIQDNQIFETEDTTYVLIEVITKTGNDASLKSELINLGMIKRKDRMGVPIPGVIDDAQDPFSFSGYFPIKKLTQLNSNTKISFVRPLYPPISNAGLVTTQGDITMRSNTVRSRFGVDGTGIKIGVISDSYDSKQEAQIDVNEGDLPGIKSTGQPSDNPEPVQVIEDLLGRPGTDEGRAMMQIVHDIAPGAKLAFGTGSVSASHLANTILRMAADTLPGGRCDVIVDDLTYLTEPFQKDGIVARAVDTAVAHGVTYFSSAGNFGNKSYEGIFNGVTNTSVMPTGQIHQFGPNATDIYQDVKFKPGAYTIVLQWNDGTRSLGDVSGATTDLDLYVLGSNGITLFGYNRSSLTLDPFEVCPFTVTEETNGKIMVVRAAGTSNVRFKYIIFRGDATILDYQSASSSTVVGHSNADSAITVGAMLYANIQPFTPVWPGVASFSSRGGTFTQKDVDNTFPQRNKPDIIAPNGVNTTVNLGGPQFNDGDTYPNFFGTSAAAPHAAGVGALLIQGRKKYLHAPASPDVRVYPYQVRQQLVSSAGKFSYLPGNFSFEGGYGYVQADSAMQQIANPRPIISTLAAIPAGAETGTQPFTVKITGKYLTSNTVIYLNNLPVSTTVSIDPTTGVGTATANISAIPAGQDPPFALFNPAKSISNIDGGFSEVLHFFSSGTKIVVKAVNKSRKYGQENPALTASVTVINGTDTLDIGQTSLTLADLRLDDLTLVTNASTFSSPRAYGISVARTTPLDANDSLLSKYEFEFDPGTLTVERMPLKITPFNKTLKYGDDISGITYSYEFDTSGVVSPHLLEEVKSLYKKSLVENGLIVVNGFNTQNPPITGPDLDSMAAMASLQSILNARKFIVVNGQLKLLSGNLSTSQIGDQRFIVDVSAQSLQNYKLDHVQSTMVDASATAHARGFLNIKALANGSAKASIPGGDLKPMVNGQLLAMVNGQLQALVNGQLKALINNTLVDVQDISFQNGQLLALVNSVWNSVPSGQIFATVNNQEVTVDLSVSNGQLQAMVNGEQMTLVNGQLQALVNGQLLALVNGQLHATVNGQLMPVINGQLMALVNGQLQALVNGQLVALVNGEIMVLNDGELQAVQDLIFSNGQLQALVNGQLQALVNGQLKALVNGVITDIPTTSFNLVNGQLQALVNGQLTAYVNGQLLALVNGQLQALVNGAGIVADSVIQLANGQLQAMVNGTFVPIANGQLQALVNGQLLAMVNGQLMALVNGKLTFAVFQNGQLQALVNGQLQALVNGQLLAMVNGQLQAVNTFSVVNGQLQALVNGETWVYQNGQLLALVNGQLQALVNNFDVSGANNNTKTVVLVDEDDINLQYGDVGAMFSMNMITGLDAGYQTLIPGAFVNENYEVRYAPALVLIDKKPLEIAADHKTKNFGDPNPPLTVTYNGFAFDETPASICLPVVLPPSIKSIDQTERRTTYSNVQINGQSNVYTATAGETLTLTGNWSEDHFANIIPGYQVYCPGCITQNYVGMTNDNFTGNQFDLCYDVSGLFAHSGSINVTFTAPSRPGIYYITQQSTWWYSCYQFGHLLQDQIANDAIAVVFVEPSNGVTANTTATDLSPVGNYPIVVGGCYFNPNYRILYKDDTLTVLPAAMSNARLQREASQVNENGSRLYPNPASTFFRLQLRDEARSANSIQVYDGIGKLTMTSCKKLSERMYEINVSQLPPGMYVLKAATAHGVETFKFIKR